MSDNGRDEAHMYVEMKVFGFALDAIAQMPVIILKDAEEKHAVPVWINTSESVSFAAQFVGREMSVRNSRKDVFTTLVERLDMTVSGIYVESLRDGVFTASVRLEPREGEELRLEVHVAEAMLLSLKYHMPVRVNDEVLTRASSLDMNDEGFAQENNARRFVDFLDHMDPAAMGKYPM
ncbi:bifunctional nuclease family protein [Geomonas sp. Red69]|uniref:Bifunctional nuclease family protein n=1 Tax=Geomonas diazotrophica TaxID=2843197 RepID=A0ABX8JIJ6_9BACT|nr:MULTISPECIES: bifunctional nuclease family protein [Geomonas]MBU5635547.1 bifunctional nuclease family protein [Geomonas diazotrophica]QWV98210.1 bifunctional nuclease family protein [Geomonas nitrogeniifigens]QXE87339.1 bifunctional nuclease family protein [Geomonas nitrogeniifigens]